MEQTLTHGDGTSVEVELAASPVDYHGQRVAQVVLRDVSERKRAEREMLRVKGQLEFLVAEPPSCFLRAIWSRACGRL